MLDQMNRNPLVVTGTPTLQTGALTVDPNQALAFNGTTNSAAAADSVSLSMTGSFSIEFFVKLAGYPGAQQALVDKNASYDVYINPTGTLTFAAWNLPAVGSVTSTVALTTGVWHHIVCVYNGNYAGIPPRFGGTTSTSLLTVEDGGGNNKATTRFSVLETALLGTVTMNLQFFDEIWPVQMRAVVYADSGGVPGTLVTASPLQTLNTPTPQWRVATPVTFPLEPTVIPAGTYHLGYIADTSAGPLNKAVLQIGRVAGGGVTSLRTDDVTSPSDPFGSVVSSTTDILNAYCDYTAVSRTGNEGKVLIYINGSRNASAVYTGGVADNANPVAICATVAAQIDEVSIWNKPLTSAQIATHYTAH